MSAFGWMAGREPVPGGAEGAYRQVVAAEAIGNVDGGLVFVLELDAGGESRRDADLLADILNRLDVRPAAEAIRADRFRREQEPF